MLKFCLHTVFWFCAATIVVWVRSGQVFAICILLVCALHASAGLSKRRTPSDPLYPEFQHACSGGGLKC